MKRCTRLSLLSLIMIGLCSTSVSGQEAEAKKDDKAKVTYADHVRPIFRDHCLGCHNASRKRADLDLSSYQGVIVGASGGEVVAPGNLTKSKLYQVVAHLAEPKMPPESSKIPEKEIAVIQKWIEGGLLETTSSVAKKEQSTFDLALSSTPLGRPETPPPMPKGLSTKSITSSKKPNSVTAIAANPWSPLVAVGGLHEVLLYNGETQEFLGVLPFEERLPEVLKFSRNGRLLLAAGGRGADVGTTVVWDVETGKRVAETGDDYDTVLAADISADHKFVALGGPDKLIKIFPTGGDKPIHEIKRHTDWVTSMEFSPDGLLLATGDRNGAVHVWEVTSGGIVQSFEEHTGAITDISWRHDSNVLATASEDGTVALWAMATGERASTIRAHTGGVRAVEFDHEGRLVTAGRDNLVRLWNTNGSKLRDFEKFDDLALEAVITHDGKYVIGGDYTGKIRVWQAEDGKLAGELSTLVPEPQSAETASAEPAKK